MSKTAADLVAAARGKVRELSPAQAQAELGACVLIDVREPGEYAEGHLPGAINLPRGVLEFKIEAHPALACSTSPALADRQRPIVLYCLSGGRSALAADSLQRLGFKDVQSLTGGIVAWRDAGLPLTAE